MKNARGELRRVADLAFEVFWEKYPRKVGKLAAKRKWDAIRPTPALAQQMLEAVAWQSEQWPSDETFIPHPSTWLHGGRWMDEKPKGMTPVAGHLENWWHKLCPHTPKCPGFRECNERKHASEPSHA